MQQGFLDVAPLLVVFKEPIQSTIIDELLNLILQLDIILHVMAMIAMIKVIFV